jgi:16S rRNA (cytidine1402-2'-O)-methyltransferase
MAATSLGLPEDIPPRSLAMLREADLLIFEEDRPARSFLKAAGVFREYLKYNEHHQQDTLIQIRQALGNRKTVLYMSDQGTPTLADPGSAPINIAWESGADIRVIPGPSSVTAALSAAPFSCDKFYFGGFLSRDPENRIRELQVIRSLSCTWVVMDTPYRLQALLDACSSVFPADQRAMIALDISGPHEDYWLGTFSALRQRAGTLTEKLNFVLVGEGTSNATALEGGADAPKRHRSPADSSRRKHR